MKELSQWQFEVASDLHRFRVVNCGRQAGKTTLAVEEIKGFALSKECRIVYIAPTYQQSRDIAWQILIKELSPVIIGKPNESRLELTVSTVNGGKSIIQLRGWESIEGLRGQQFDFMVIDEVAMMRNFWLNWQEVLLPTLLIRKGHVMFISTPKGFNHFYDLYHLEDDDNDFRSFHFTSYDNPYADREELERQRTKSTEDRFAQEYMADFRKTEGLVYKEFRRERDLFDSETPKGEIKKIIVGCDFGYTNPAAQVKIEINKDDTYWITEEWYKTGQTTEQIIQKCKMMTPHEVYPDPAEPDRIAEMVSNGLNCREVSKDIVAGVNRIRELFKQGRVKIHKDCKNLIWELETYHYPEGRNDRNLQEVPEKKDDHLMDALRYALYSINPEESTDTGGFEEFNILSTDW